MTLAVGLALDPSYLLAKRDPEPQAAPPCPAPAPGPVCPPQQAVDDERPPAPRPPVEVEVPSTFRGVIAGVGLGLGLAALPAPSGGGIAHVAATWERASIGLEAVLHPGVRGGELLRKIQRASPTSARLRSRLAAGTDAGMLACDAFEACDVC